MAEQLAAGGGGAGAGGSAGPPRCEADYEVRAQAHRYTQGSGRGPWSHTYSPTTTPREVLRGSTPADQHPGAIKILAGRKYLLEVHSTTAKDWS